MERGDIKATIIYYDNNRLDSNWSIEYTISNNQLLMYEEPEEGNPTSVYNIKELTKTNLSFDNLKTYGYQIGQMPQLSFSVLHCT